MPLLTPVIFRETVPLNRKKGLIALNQLLGDVLRSAIKGTTHEIEMADGLYRPC